MPALNHRTCQGVPERELRLRMKRGPSPDLAPGYSPGATPGTAAGSLFPTAATPLRGDACYLKHIPTSLPGVTQAALAKGTGWATRTTQFWRLEVRDPGAGESSSGAGLFPACGQPLLLCPHVGSPLRAHRKRGPWRLSPFLRTVAL